MKWILIAYLSGGTFSGYISGGPLSAEFETEQACRAAVVFLQAKKSHYVWAECLPKRVP